jgi:hypothetical protein
MLPTKTYDTDTDPASEEDSKFKSHKLGKNTIKEQTEAFAKA